MNELKDILDMMLKPIQLETKTGYQNKSVIGGFYNYINNWVQKARCGVPEWDQELKELSDLFIDYDKIQPDERKMRIGKVLKIIESLSKRRETIRNEEDASVAATDAPHHLSVNGIRIPIEYVPGIGKKRAQLLYEELGIKTVEELLEYYPRDYLDYSKMKKIYQVGNSDGYETVQGVVINQIEIPTRPGAQRFSKTIIYDDTGVASLVAFGKRIDYMKKSIKPGVKLVVSGRFKRAYKEIQTSDYTYEILSDEDADLIHTGRIVPVYPLTSRLNQRNLRRWIKDAIDRYSDRVPETLPLDIRRRLNLISRSSAIRNIHFPESHELLKQAKRRLSFDELFMIELGMGLRKKRWETDEKGISFQRRTDMLDRFINSLPFKLTPSQERVFKEIEADMMSPKPMNRLLQGDVGSGKTVVAAMAMLLAVDNSYQAALMAPTEILSEQHYNTLTKLLSNMNVKIVLLHSDMQKHDKDEALRGLQTGEVDIAVGTHALIQSGVEFARLGLVITDEQHRFGVMQRAQLKKKGENPDVLVMTATPIPRTLALTIYGDLNVSVIDELPPGRQKVITKWVSESKRKEIYDFIESQIAQGRQAYIVYPLVEESEKLEDLKAATEMAEHFQKEVFPHLKIGLIHGRMRSEEKQDVMEKFKRNEINILVSTTVIEVGIDVPNASIILIEHAERFGLAQLHQLRGRVGRSSFKSYCLLIANPTTEEAVRRMNAMVRTNDGFQIAEEDLAIRGPGEFFGTKQAGMPDLKVADLVRDLKLIEEARKEAFRIVEEDPRLERPEHQLIKQILQEKWQENLEIMSIG